MRAVELLRRAVCLLAVLLPLTATAQTATFNDPAVPAGIVSEPFYTIVDVLNHDRTITQYASQSISNAGYNCTAAPGLASQTTTPHTFAYDGNLFEIGPAAASPTLTIAPVTSPYYNGCSYGPLTSLPSTATSVLATSADSQRHRVFVLTGAGGSSPETVIGYDGSPFYTSNTSALVSFGAANLDTGATYTAMVTDQDGAYGDTAITELRTATTAGNLWIYTSSGGVVKVLAPDGSSLPAINAFILHNPNDLGGGLLVLVNQDGLTSANSSNPPLDTNPFTVIDLGQLHQLITASAGATTVTLPAVTRINATTPYYAMLGAGWNPVNKLLYAVVGGADSSGSIFRHVLSYDPYHPAAPAETTVADVTSVPIAPPYYPQVALNAAAGTMQFLTQNPTAAYTVSLTSGAATTATQLGSSSFPSDAGFAPTAMTVNPLAGNTWFASSSGKVDALTLPAGALVQSYLDLTAPEVVAASGNSSVHVLGYFPYNSDTNLFGTNVTVTATKQGGTPYTFGTATSTSARVNGTDITGNFPTAGIYTLTASFPGDSVQAAFTSSPVVVAVATPPFTTAVTLTATAATATTGTALVTLTGSSWVPAGTIKIYDSSSGAVVGTYTLSGPLSNPISIPITFSASTTRVTADYLGDAQNALSTSPTALITAPPTLSLTLTSSAVSTSSTVSGTVKFSSTQTIPPSGFVNVSTIPSGGTTPTTVATVSAASAYAAGGIAFSFTSPSTSGTYSISASYAGDANYPSVSSATSTLDVNTAAAVTTTLAVTPPATATTNLVFKINFKLASATSSQTPSGNINVTAQLAGTTTTTNIGILDPAQAYAAAGTNLTATFPTAGVWTISASFLGDQNFGPSAGTAMLTVTAASVVATTLKITAPASVAVNTPYTAVVLLTAASTLTNGPSGAVTLTVTSPTGAIVSTINTTAASAFLNGNGYSAAIPAAATAGTYTLTATFAADSNYSASSTTSTVIVGTAAPIATSLSLTAPATAPLNSSYNAVIKLTPATVSTPAPTGNVILTSATTGYPTVTIATITAAQALAAGGFTVAIPANVAVTSVLTATYAGDANYSAATPVASTVVVTNPTSLTVASESSKQINTPFSVSITLTTPGTTAPAGNIVLTATPAGSTASITLGTYAAPTAFNTTLTVTPSLAAAGTYIITATYAGSSVYGASAGSSGVSIFSYQTPSLSLTGPTAANAQTPMAYTVVMCCSPIGTAPNPTGNITLSSTINGAVGPSATVSAVAAINQASNAATLTFPSAGTYLLTATYPGDSAYAPVTAPTLTVTVAAATAPHFTAVLSDNSQLNLDPATPSGTRSILYTAYGGFNTPVTLSYASLGDEAEQGNVKVVFTDPVTNQPVTTFTPSAVGNTVKVTVTYTNFPTAALSSPGSNSLYLAGGLFGLALLGLRRRARHLMPLLGICLAIFLGALITGCNGTGTGTLFITATPANAMQNSAPQQVSFQVYVNKES